MSVEAEASRSVVVFYRQPCRVVYPEENTATDSFVTWMNSGHAEDGEVVTLQISYVGAVTRSTIL